MKNYLPLLILLSISTSVFAQSKISGKIIDAATNSGLVGVNVAVKGTILGTITDANGAFTLKKY